MTFLVYPPASEDFGPTLRALLRTAGPEAGELLGEVGDSLPLASTPTPSPVPGRASGAPLHDAEGLTSDHDRRAASVPSRARRERGASPHRRDPEGSTDEDDFLLFFSPGSCSLAPLATLARLERPFRICRVSAEERASEAFRALNPKGQVPVLLTAEGPLTETTAILIDLCTRGSGAGYLPHPGTRLRDRFHEWLGYLGGGFHPAFQPWFLPERFVGDPELHEHIRQRALGVIEGHFRYVDSRLADGPYLLGEDYSVLDAYLFALARWGEPLFDLAEIAPRVAAHLRRLRGHSEIRFALDLEDSRQSIDSRRGFRGEVSLSEALAQILETSAA